jgi:hypothetical protein
MVSMARISCPPPPQKKSELYKDEFEEEDEWYSLADYVFFLAGIYHDHPVCVHVASLP